jgi:TonB-dependent receptor
LHVVVPADRETFQDVGLTASIYALEAFLVEGDREGNSLAITRQRRAMNVKNVAATDSLGNIADGNPADFIQRLPGVTLESDGAYAARLAIRGISGALNSVTMDGDPIAAANSGTMSRNFEYEQASIGLLGSVEVTKAPTPDMNANALGGSINFVTKSAFDRKDERLLLYTIAAVPQLAYVRPAEKKMAQPIKGISPSLNFTYSGVFGREKKFGLLLTGTLYAQEEASAASILTYQDTVADPAYVRSVNLPRPVGITRVRTNAGARLDYRWSERTIVTLNLQYNYYYGDQDARTHTLSTGAVIAQLDANGNRIGTGTIRPGYTSTRTEVFPGTNSVSSLTMGALDKAGRTYQVQPSVIHRFDRTTIDYGISKSDSNNYYDSHGPGVRHLDSKLKGSVTASLANIGWIVDRSKSLDWPTVTQTAGRDLYDLNNYTGLQLTDQTMMSKEDLKSARFNLRREVDTVVPVTVKAGGSFYAQHHVTTNANTRFSYTGTSIGRFADTTDNFSGKITKGYRRPPWIDPYMVADNIVSNPGQWTEDLAYRFSQKLQNERDLTESVSALYAMGQMTLGDLGILGGLRVERTGTKGEGARNQITPEERVRRAAWVGALTAAETERRAYAQYGGRLKNSGEYQNIFPGLHFRYTPTKGLVGRLSYSTSIGRPSIRNVVPTVIANYDAETMTATNPSLKPQYSDNFDASVEYYFEPAGLISAGVFLKEVSNFIYADTTGIVGAGRDNGFEGEYQGFRLTTDRNGGSARYRGFELNYQQQFAFLPGIWRGFGLNANYTQLETRGDYGGKTTTTAVARFIPRSANLGLSFTRDRLSLQLNCSYRGHFLNAISASPALTSYNSKLLLLGVRARYTLTKKLSFFCDMDNVLRDTHIVQYVVNPDRPIQSRVYVPKVTVGFQGRY